MSDFIGKLVKIWYDANETMCEKQQWCNRFINAKVLLAYIHLGLPRDNVHTYI